jgi:gamma-glutamylputrescine oxidase
MNQNFSYWENQTFFNRIDVCIVGSGIVGLFTALEIKRKRPDFKVVVLERGFLPDGASTKNAGFCCFGSLSELLDDLNRFTIEESVELVKMRFEGLKKLRKELGDEAIGYDACGGFELFSENDREIFDKCADNIGKYNRLFKEAIGEEVYKIDNDAGSRNQLSSNIKYVIINKYEGSIDTGKMISALLKLVQLNDIIILNNIEIKDYLDNGNEVVLKTGKIDLKTKKVIFTTNGFAKQLLPELDVVPARAQVLVTSPIEGLKLKGTFHYDRGYNYFRNIDGRVLLGGGRNLDFETETTTEMSTTRLIQDYLENMLRDLIIPDKKFTIDYRWSGIMGVGSIKKPIIKMVKPNVYVAVRMGGMGVAIGSKVGELAAEMVNKDC